MINEFSRVTRPFLICYLMKYFPSSNQIPYHQHWSSRKALKMALKNAIGGKSVAKSFKLSLKLTLTEVSEDFISVIEIFL